MNHLDRIEAALARMNKRPSPHSRKMLDRAYREAADAIKRSYRRPSQIIISPTTPPWVARRIKTFQEANNV